MTDLLGIDALLSEEEKATRDRVAALVDEHIRPHVGQWYEDAVLPDSIFPVLAQAGLFGMHLEGYGLSLIHISEPTRREWLSRMPSSA